MPSRRRPAVEAVVFQWPYGMLARQRSPWGPARSRAILVLAPSCDEDQPLGVEVGPRLAAVRGHPGAVVPMCCCSDALLFRCRACLFLCVSPRLEKTYQSVARQTRTPGSAASFAAVSCSAMSQLSSTSPRMKASCSSSFEPAGFPRRPGSSEPASRYCRCQVIAVDSTTENRAAARAESPPSIASTTQRRKSKPYARATSASQIVSEYTNHGPRHSKIPFRSLLWCTCSRHCRRLVSSIDHRSAPSGRRNECGSVVPILMHND